MNWLNILNDFVLNAEKHSTTNAKYIYQWYSIVFMSVQFSFTFTVQSYHVYPLSPGD